MNTSHETIKIDPHATLMRVDPDSDFIDCMVPVNSDLLEVVEISEGAWRAVNAKDLDDYIVSMAPADADVGCEFDPLIELFASRPVH